MPETSQTAEIAQGNTGQPTQQQGQAAEAWRSHLPEDFRSKSMDEIAQTFAKVHKDFGALNNDVGKQRKQIEDLTNRSQQYEHGLNQWNQWWKNVEPHWSGVEEYLRGRQSGQQPQQATQAQRQPAQQGFDASAFENWDRLEPQQQARTLLEAIQGQLSETIGGHRKTLDDALQAEMRKMNEYLQGREKYYQNYMNIRDRVWEERLKNPNLDMNAAMERAVKVLSGQEDPLTLGIQLSTMEQDRNKWLEEQKQIWQKEQEDKAKAQAAAPPLFSTTPPSYRPPAQQGRMGAAALRENAAKVLAEKYGTKIF